MEFSGESLIAAGRDTVWGALIDPATMTRCVGGDRVASAGGDATDIDGPFVVRVGEVETRFAGVAVTAIDAPHRCTLTAEADDGTTVRADLALTDNGGGTRVCYVVTARGGAADRDAAAAEAAARRHAAVFAARLEAATATPAPPLRSADAPQAVGDARQLHGNRVATGLTPLVWGGVVVLIILGVLVWQLT